MRDHAPNKMPRLAIKARSDSKLHNLPQEQRDLVEQWLFQENLSYKRVKRLCAEDLELKVSENSLKRYYRREKFRWVVNEKAERRSQQEEKAGETRDAETRYRALLDKMITVALEAADNAETPLERRAVTDYAKVLISARRESHEALRAATTREKFEFDAATACLIHQTKVQAIAADESLGDGERIQKIREHLFGPDLPESDHNQDEPDASTLSEIKGAPDTNEPAETH